MAQTKLRISEQLAASASARSILITDGSSKPSYHAPTTGADSILFWDDSASNWAPLTMGSGVAITGTVLSATGTAGYGTVQEEGTSLTARNTINFIGSGITAADNSGSSRTDVTLNTFLNTLATSGAVNLASHVSGDLPYANLTQGSALSVLGVAGNATADVASIAAGVDGQVLRRSGTTIGWGQVALNVSAAVTGTLPQGNGGTGFSTYTTGDTLYASATDTLSKRAIGSNGNFFRVSGGLPVWTTAASTDLSDTAAIAMLADNETVSGTWTFSNNITVPATPTNSTHATSKQYVDNLIQGVSAKAAVRVATTANGTLSSAFANGSTVDGITLATNDRILIKDQTTQAENGVYTVNASGAPTRATDMDTWAELVSAFVFVETGTVNTDSGYLCTVNAGGTLGTTAVTWVQFSGAGQITAGNGLTKTGNTLDVVTASSSRIVVNTDSIDLATTAATPGSFGSATQVATFTVDAYGRLTASGNTTIALASGAISDFNEAAQDAVGTILVDSATIDFTYADATPSITAIVIDDSITYAKMQNIATGSLIGRSTASTGDPETITVSSGLTISGGNLTHADTSSVANVDTSGAQIIDTITFDTYGHVTAVTTRNMVLDDLNDTTITSPASGQVLTYNGSAWVNSAASGTVSEAYVDSFTGTNLDLDLNDGTVVDAEGTSISFTTPSDKTKLLIYRNGVMLSRSSDDGTTRARDYTMNTSTHIITFAVPIASGETLKFVKLS